MKKFLSIFVVLSFMLSSYVEDIHAATLRMTCRSKGRAVELCKKAIDEWIEEWFAKHGERHKVEIVTLPSQSNECFGLYQQWLSAGSFDIDILLMDTAWIGQLADYLFALDSVYAPNEINLEDYFDAIKANMYSSNGRLIALPWYTDCGIMYYRKDLLEKYNRPVPKTWEELLETALYIQNEERKEEDKQTKFYGLVFQAKAEEVLTCNFVEFIDSFGGYIIKDGKVVVNSEQCLNATMFMIKCINSITSRSVLNYYTEEARGVFQSGNAVFMRNWPYAWALLNDPATVVAGKVGVMPIPPSEKGGKSSGVLGGWFLTVSKYSKHTKLAADLIKFLTSKEQQKIQAEHSYLPAFKSLYSDENILKINPFFADLYHPLQNAVSRPSIEFGKNYSRASTEIYNGINTILTDSTESNMSTAEVKRLLDRMNKKLEKILHKTSKDVGIEKSVDSKEGFFSRIISWIKSFLGFGK